MHSITAVSKHCCRSNHVDGHTASEMGPRSPADLVLALRHSKQWTDVRPSWEGGGVRTDTLGSMEFKRGLLLPTLAHPSLSPVCEGNNLVSWLKLHKYVTAETPCRCASDRNATAW
jgi:hypothetical protein